MARTCPACGLTLRANDPEAWVQVLDGSVLHLLGWRLGGYWVCRDCGCIANPDLPPLEHVPPPAHVDPAVNPAWAFWCPCCRMYARENDPVGLSNAVMRVTQEDLDAYPYLRPQPSGPGALRLCRDCWAVWGPVVQARWERGKIIPAGMLLEALGTNMV